MQAGIAEINFERNKNLKALGYTTGVVTRLFLLFGLVSWRLPVTPLPVVDAGVEVNLGNSDQGMGNLKYPVLLRKNSKPITTRHPLNRHRRKQSLTLQRTTKKMRP